jgi:hypothetical protein
VCLLGGDLYDGMKDFQPVCRDRESFSSVGNFLHGEKGNFLRDEKGNFLHGEKRNFLHVRRKIFFMDRGGKTFFMGILFMMRGET